MDTIEHRETGAFFVPEICWIGVIGVLGAEHLIPLKMYAWINLLERKRAGEHVNEKDLKKHKYDVFRLLQIVTAGAKVESEGLVTESIHRYIEEISAVDESEVRLLQMGMGHSEIGVTMNTYTHLGLDDAKDEMIRLEELEQARKEIDKTNGIKPMKQNMFKAI